MTEQEKMLAGKIYDPSDENLLNKRTKAHHLCQKYNVIPDFEFEKRQEIKKELLPNVADSAYLQGPIFFDYGEFITMGENSYANFNLTILDCCPVTIGDNVFMGPNVSILTPMHPFLASERNAHYKEDGRTMYDDEYAKPITIKSDCWIAGNVTILGGVTIGSNCVIGAGSVVTRDIPDFSLAAGNPCRVIRKITEKDSIKYKDLF